MGFYYYNIVILALCSVRVRVRLGSLLLTVRPSPKQKTEGTVPFLLFSPRQTDVSSIFKVQGHGTAGSRRSV